jgi:fatty acyl-CoA reductase
MSSEISQYLSKQNIFLTGVTGFLGKVMLWKILKEAGETVKVYVLVRSSKDGNARKRVDDIFSCQIFDELLSTKPHLKDRVVPMEGDITQEGFGLSESDTKFLEKEITLIIHSAATTKFTENLKLAVNLNVLAVQRVVALAKRCTHLNCLVQISTAYVAADKTGQATGIREELYPMKVTPYEVINMVANATLEEAEAMTESVLGRYPNTYSFTKALGEHLLMQEKHNLPVCVVRPSIVTAAQVEPLPGWIDVLLGPAGLFLATGSGALRVMRGNVNNVCDFIPVDYCVNTILAAAWRTGAGKLPDASVTPLYHATTSSANPFRWLWAEYLVVPYFKLHPPARSFGYPFAHFWGHGPSFKFVNFVMHWIPAYLGDSLRMVQGKKPFLVRATNRLHKVISILTHFTCNEWIFENQTTQQLDGDMNDTDKITFVTDVRRINWDVYFIIFLQGIRKFLMVDQPQKQQQKPQQESKSLFASMMDYSRVMLTVISFGCLVYFFRQNYWLLKLRAKQIRQIVSQRFLTLTASNSV